MKKRIVVIVALSLVLGLLGGCGGSQANRENKLYVYNWSEYIPEEVYQMFEDEKKRPQCWWPPPEPLFGLRTCALLLSGLTFAACSRLTGGVVPLYS